MITKRNISTKIVMVHPFLFYSLRNLICKALPNFDGIIIFDSVCLHKHETY